MTQKTPPIVLGYWPRKRIWVDVPLFYVPEEAVTEEGLYQCRFVPLDGHHIESLPRRENRVLEMIETKESIVPRNWPEKALKQFCKLNDIPYFWVTGRSSPRKTRRSGVTRRKERKLRLLKPEEYKKILKELRKIDEQSALIVEILWFHNLLLGQGGGYVTLEEVLRAKVEDVSPDLEYGPHHLSLKRTAIGTTHMTAIYLPDKLWGPLCRRVDRSILYVFSNKYGGPLLPSQIDRHLKNAARRAGFKDVITSLSLRPELNEKDIERSVRRAKKHGARLSISGCLEPISPKEWTKICEHFPSILNRKGRKGTHHPMDLLNAILHHLKGCSLRKLPLHFPPYRAVETQIRRWKKSGILDQILEFRKANPIF